MLIEITAGSANAANYCTVEIRNNSMVIPSTGMWKCLATTPTGSWWESTYDDSAWSYATNKGFNTLSNLHVAGLHEDAERIWTAQSTDNTIYCRLKVPSKCSFDSHECNITFSFN